MGVVDEGAAVLSPGDVIGGKYAIEDELGAGAMGVVYRARHLALGRRVALRAARPALRAVESAAASFVAGPSPASDSALRTELLAARAQWELEELARLELDEGRTFHWYARAVVIAARAVTRGRSIAAPPDATFTSLAQEFERYRHEHVNEVAVVTNAPAFLDAIAQFEEAARRAAATKSPKDRAALLPLYDALAARFEQLVLE